MPTDEVVDDDDDSDFRVADEFDSCEMNERESSIPNYSPVVSKKNNNKVI